MFIEYTFTMDDGKVLHYRIEYERPREHLLDASQYPEWSRLEFHQCPNCPLNLKEHSHCPVAIDAHEILQGFSEIISCKEVDILVKTPEREYFKRTDAQTGLRAILGFVMATSACPITSAMRGMAFYHLPFASVDETVFRVASSYLLKQYFLQKKGLKADFEFDGLKVYFKEMQTVNFHVLDRIRDATEADANLNVLATLFTISSMLSLTLDRHLKEIEHLFI